MWVTLNEAEQRLAKYLAKRRYTQARSDGRKNARIGPQDNHETDLNGIGSEIAACKLLNVYPDTEIGHTPDADVLTMNGNAIDVKSTKYENGKLIAVPWKKGKAAQFYMLMIGEFPKYRVAGIMSGDELINDERLTDLGHGQTYAASQSELQSIEDWLKDYEGVT